MSLSKTLCLISDLQNCELKDDNYRRDSFEDRFCDDLSQFVFQFLSLKDKLRLECVSKQFQRTVFEKHNILSIEVKNEWKKSKGKGRVEKGYYLYIKNKLIDLKSLEVLLKKCPNIKSIRMNGDYREYDFNPMFSLIIENCNNLNETNIPMNYLNESNFQEFERIFGQQIKSLFQLRDEFNFNSFPNIKELHLNPIDNKLIAPELKLNKLKKLEITISYGKEHILQNIVFILPQLTHIIINLREMNVKTNFESLECISNLKNLIHLSFRAILRNNNQLWDSFKQLSTDCPKLKSIECCFVFTDESDINKINSILKAFPELKRLDLRLSL